MFILQLQSFDSIDLAVVYHRDSVFDSPDQGSEGYDSVYNGAAVFDSTDLGA